MKKLVLTITAILLLLGTSAFAGSCNIPKILKKGNVVSSFFGTVKIVEIDKKSCWMKVEKVKGMQGSNGWVNINNLKGASLER